MKKKNKSKNKSILLILIMIMLILVALSAIWIIHRGHKINEAREREAAQQAQQQAEAAEESAAENEENAVDNAIASHVYSNRGSAGAEEHSFKAYDAAIEAGSRYIGVEVVISSDDVLYVSHDLNALNMTGYNGMYEYISSETADGLTTEAGNPVLRLSQVFDKYGKDINYIVELKSREDDCVSAFEELVDSYGLEGVITAACMYPEVLEKLDEKYPDMPKLYMCWSQADFDYVADEPYIDIISVKAPAGLMTESNCDIAHDNGKKFSAWTLDSEETIKKAIDMGVDTYFTNDTPLALSLEKDYGMEKRGGQ